MSPKRYSSHLLLFRCPNQHKHRYCPFEKLRKLSVEERMTYINNMTLHQLKIFEDHYNKCVAESNLNEKSLHN
jgi:hypothetical protein